MNHKISDECIKCFACIRSRLCPEEAIVEHNEVYSIDNDKCTDCGTCYKKQKYFCPMQAFIKA